MAEAIVGTISPVSPLSQIVDVNSIRKHYKLPEPSGTPNLKETKDDRERFINIVVSTVATKDLS